MSHVRTRNPICPRMLANSFCRDSDSADSSDKGYFRSFRTKHSSHMLREGARPEVVRYILGHANIDVTQMFTARADGSFAQARWWVCVDWLPILRQPRVSSINIPGLPAAYLGPRRLPAFRAHLLMCSFSPDIPSSVSTADCHCVARRRAVQNSHCAAFSVVNPGWHLDSPRSSNKAAARLPPRNDSLSLSRSCAGKESPAPLPESLGFAPRPS